MSVLIQIDGNIGSGKSTLIDRILKEIPNLQLVEEPVKEWQDVKDKDGINALDWYYKDPKKMATIFQKLAFITRMKKMAESVKKANGKVLLSERGIRTDMRIFAENARDMGLMTDIEYKIYERVFNDWVSLFPVKTEPEVHIYLRTSLDVCVSRIDKRDRKEEKGKIDSNYLKGLHQKHEDWLAKDRNVMIVDGDKDNERDKEYFNTIIEEIKKRIKALGSTSEESDDIIPGCS
jgi:deoxyadenosine/deoxycytidine kinase